MIAQKQRVRVILDIECYDDLNLEDINWREVLQLEGGEEVYTTIKEFDPFWFSITISYWEWCDSSKSGTRTLHPVPFLVL